MDSRSLLKDYAEIPITRHMILTLLRNYQRPNDKISELLKSKELIALKRGLYIVGEKTDLLRPEPFLIANHLRGPSYVSLESALSYWNMIPERVYEISSVTLKSSKSFDTEVGRFSFKQLKAPFYSLGIKYVNYSNKQTALVASPEKALCDKIIVTPNLSLRSIKQTEQFLIEDLRIGFDELKELNSQAIESWIKYAPKHGSLQMLVNTLKKLC
jgi:hypothetical protein